MGGFGLAGVPEALIKCVARKGVTGLVVVSNEVGTPDHGIGLWDGQMDRVTLSYVGSNRVMEQKFLNGEIELELTPQGTLAGMRPHVIPALACGGSLTVLQSFDRANTRRGSRYTRVLHTRWIRHVAPHWRYPHSHSAEG